MEIKISKKLISLMVAGGITLAPIGGLAENNNYQQGSFITSTAENSKYDQYVVISGDNLSLISMKICAYFGHDMETIYWPALAFLNDYPRIIKPGDIIYFPNTFEALQELTEDLRKVEWTARYIQKNKIYGKKKTELPRQNVEGILSNIYGDDVCVDEDFIRLYLSFQGMDEDYILSDIGEFNTDMMFDLTQGIPSIEELEKYANHSLTMEKVKK